MFSKKASSLYISNTGVEAVAARASGNRWAVESFSRASGKSAAEQALQAVTGAGIKRGVLCASIPDTSANAIILDFEELPENRKDALEVVRFKAGRFLNLSLSGATLGYHVISRENGVKVFAVVPKKELVSELGSFASENGFDLGRVSLHSINLANLYFSVNDTGPGSFACLFVEEDFFTVIFFYEGALDYYRCREAEHSNGEGLRREIAATFLSYRGRRPSVSSWKVYLFDAKGGAADSLKKAAGSAEVVEVRPDAIIDLKDAGANAFHVMAALGAMMKTR